MTLGIENINLPMGLIPEDSLYFEPYLNWEFADPKVKSYFGILIYKSGLATNPFFKLISNLAPWRDFDAHYNRFFFLGSMLEAFKKNKLRIVFSNKYFYCINAVSDNYFHWCTEALPKMIYVKNNFKSDIIFFIPFPLSDYQRTSLSVCNLKYHESNNDVSLFFNLKVVENLTGTTGYYHTVLLKEASQVLKANFKILDNRKKRVYVTRKNSKRRRIVNEDELIVILLKYEFEIYDFDEVGFEKQIEILANSSIFISQHGAALTNMIFMEAGSRIVELLPKKIFNDKCYFTLAGSMLHKYFFVFCEMNGVSHITSDFLVNIQEFEKIVVLAVDK